MEGSNTLSAKKQQHMPFGLNVLWKLHQDHVSPTLDFYTSRHLNPDHLMHGGEVYIHRVVEADSVSINFRVKVSNRSSKW